MIVKYDTTLSYVLTYYSLLHTSWTIALIVHVWMRVLKIWLQLGLSIMRDRHLSDSLTNGLWWACENYPWTWKSRITMNHLEILESLFLLGLEPSCMAWTSWIHGSVFGHFRDLRTLQRFNTRPDMGCSSVGLGADDLCASPQSG